MVEKGFEARLCQLRTMENLCQLQPSPARPRANGFRGGSEDGAMGESNLHSDRKFLWGGVEPPVNSQPNLHPWQVG